MSGNVDAVMMILDRRLREGMHVIIFHCLIDDVADELEDGQWKRLLDACDEGRGNDEYRGDHIEIHGYIERKMKNTGPRDQRIADAINRALDDELPEHFPLFSRKKLEKALLENITHIL